MTCRLELPGMRSRRLNKRIAFRSDEHQNSEAAGSAAQTIKHSQNRS